MYMKRIAIILLASALIHLPSSICRADTLTLDLTAILDDYPQTDNGYWEDTYIDGPIEAGLFRTP